MSSERQKRLAVLIDADNTSAAVARELFAEIAKYGIASVKRIYGDWSSPTLSAWRKILLRHALVPVQQFAYTKGKDATDMGLIIDAMDLLYSGTFDGFCLVSSDSDFTPLAARQELDAGIRNTLNKAVKNCTDEATGWAFVGQIGIYLSQTLPDFDTRTYGYSQLSKMLKALGGLQFRHDEASRMFCRKIPYGELIKLLANEALPKFRNKQGWAKIHAVEKYVNPRWSFKEYGFDSFADLLNTVHGVEVHDDSLRMPAASPAE